MRDNVTRVYVGTVDRRILHMTSPVPLSTLSKGSHTLYVLLNIMTGNVPVGLLKLLIIRTLYGTEKSSSNGLLKPWVSEMSRS